MTLRLPLVLAFVSAALTSWPMRASAGPFELFGFGPDGVAEVNARAARADDGGAAFYNPAGLGLGQGAHVLAAPTYAISALSAQGKALPLSDPFGVTFGFDATVPLEGVLKDRIRVGFGAYAMPNGIARILAHASDEPFYPYYDNRSQRAAILPAFGVKLAPGFALGIGVNVLAGVSGPATVAPGASGAPEPRIEVAAKTALGADVGLRFDPSRSTHLGLVYRQGLAVPARLDTRAIVGGVPLVVKVDYAESLFDPDAFVAAAAFDLGPLAFELDATYSAWSSYLGPFVDVDASLPGVHITSVPPPMVARDVVSARAAGTLRIPVGAHELVGRGGLGFEPSMLRSLQQGTTNLLDGDKIFVGAGGSLKLGSIPGHAITLGLGLGANVLLGYAQTKRACEALPCSPDTVAGPNAQHPSAHIDNPGYPKLTGGGALFVGSIGAGVEL